MAPIPPRNNQGYEITNMFFVITYSLIDARVSSKCGYFSNYEKYPETYHIGESWSIGSKFITQNTWPVYWAMFLKDWIKFAFSPPGRGLAWLAWIVEITISLQSGLSCCAYGETNSKSLEMICICFEFFVWNFSALVAIETSSSPCNQSKLFSLMDILE